MDFQALTCSWCRCSAGGCSKSLRDLLDPSVVIALGGLNEFQLCPQLRNLREEVSLDDGREGLKEKTKKMSTPF